MGVIVIQDEAYKELMDTLTMQRNLFLQVTSELKENKTEKYISVEEVAELTGFSKDWVYDHKDDIGFFQNGGHLKFWKPAVLKFMEQRSVPARVNKALKTLNR